MATPWGRYRWLRLPFGVKVSSEVFQKRLHQAIEGLEGCVCVADDVVIHGRDRIDHDRNLRAFLERCQEVNIKLNWEKCQLRKSEVKFMGHVISRDGMKPDPDKVKPFVEMAPPTDKKAVERLRGSVNFLSQYLPRLSDVFKPIGVLTHENVEWQWGPAQQSAFDELKRLVTEAPVLAYYDPKKDLMIQSDASCSGLGAALLQDNRPIAYASRTLTETETRYATIEKEMLAIVFALEKWHQFTYGRHVDVRSDHKPLEMISRKPLDKAPKRLQGMLIRALAYDITITYQPGRLMHLADTLSRAPIRDSASDSQFETVNIVTNLSVTKEKADQIRKMTEQDPVLQALKETIQKGWPEYRSQLVGEYYSFRDELAVVDGIIFRGERLVIPKIMRKTMMADIHVGHIGAEGCLRRAREMLYWPNMNNDMKDYIQRCETCNEYAEAQAKETMIPHETTQRPWEKIGTDPFKFDSKDYLITVDYFSNMWEIDRLYSTNAKTVIRKLKAHCARYGIPDEIVSDGGPQYMSSEFAEFCKDWGIKHTVSSPYHSQSNGKAESAVKAAKKMLRKAQKEGQDPYLAMLNIRNTPQQGIGLSPVQRLMGRRTKTTLPTSVKLLQSEHDKNVVEKLKRNTQRQEHYYNKGAHDLRELNEGDCVRIKPRPGEKPSWQKGIVKGKVDIRSYEVETETGKVYRRNRRYLRKSKEDPPEVVQSDPEMYEPHDNVITGEGAMNNVPHMKRNVPNIERNVPNIERNVPNMERDVPNMERNVTNVPNIERQAISEKSEVLSDTNVPSAKAHTPSAICTPMKTRSGREIRKPAKYNDYV